MLFDSWMNLFRIFVMSIGCYVGLVVILRVSGNRTLSKMNSFDFVVTIALGSTFGAAILQKSVTLADGLFAFSMLVGLQFVTTWISVRSHGFADLIKSEPVVLFRGGAFLHEAMKRSHVTEDEVRSGMREKGFAHPDEVLYVILEENGKIVTVGKP